MGVGGNEWELMGVSGGGWEWVGARFSITHFKFIMNGVYI